MVIINKQPQLLMFVKKKRNIFILSICTIVSFILYQLYFFIAISSVNSGNKVLTVLDHEAVKKLKVIHHRHEADKYINDDGVIRGILLATMPKYRPDSKNQFQCLYSKQFIPFENVNDDYCDCDDSTDEPSTSACVNGTFYCDTQHPNKKMPLNKVPSNKVNDGICDCCDGSDEWLQGPGQKLLSQSSVEHYRHYVSKCISNCYK